MKEKIETRYALGMNCQLIVNEEVKDNMCLVDLGEPCSGILKHWGSKKQLINELKLIIKELEDFKIK